MCFDRGRMMGYACALGLLLVVSAPGDSAAGSGIASEASSLHGARGLFSAEEAVFDYGFQDNVEGWESVAIGHPLTDPTFEHADGALRIASTDNATNYGWWNSPDGAAPIVGDSLYRSLWTVRSDVTDRSQVPSVRLRVNASDFQQANYLRIDSSGDGAGSPDADGEAYSLYFASPEGAAGDTWQFFFELINFGGENAANGYLALDSLVVDRLGVPNSGTHVRTYNFEQDEEGWVFSGDINGITAPAPVYPGQGGGALGLVANGNADCFGFWTSSYSDLPLGAEETLYRLIYSLRTDLADPTAVPALRARLQPDNFQSASVLRVESFDDCSNGPGTTGRDYALYYLAPSSASGAHLLASFDLVGMNPNDSATAGLYLDGVVVETLALDSTPTPTETPAPTVTPTPPPTVSPTPTPGEAMTLNLPGGVTMELVPIPAGSFEMGRYPGEQDSVDREDPQHAVTIDYDFHMCRTEVTQAQWEAVMGDNPADDHGVGDDYPVYRVSWNDVSGADGFVEALNAHLASTGQNATVRLPSEAEWEYGCRAGTATRFYWGDDPSYTEIDDYAWHEGNSPSATMPVGGKTPNAFGLYDMSGNVWEWCLDGWHSDYTGAPSDGSAWNPDGGGLRLFRGGDWYASPQYCRSAYRLSNSPTPRSLTIGFRLVAPPPTPTPTGPPLPTGTPTPGETRTITLPGDVALDLITIPAGAFDMGRYPGEESSQGSEEPQHRVTIGYDFYLGVTEVTQAQWEAVTNDNPCVRYGVGDEYPVYFVSWEDVAGPGGFIETLNAHLSSTGQNIAVRLPSEAEWEYGCRAWTATRFYWGDDPDYSEIGDYAWDSVSSEWGTQPVGGKIPNAFGLYDMSGNVREWCQDDWHANYYNGAPTDGSPWGDGTAAERVYRGGDFDHEGRYCRSARRDSDETDRVYPHIGLRLAADIVTVP